MFGSSHGPIEQLLEPMLGIMCRRTRIPGSAADDDPSFRCHLFLQAPEVIWQRLPSLACVIQMSNKIRNGAVKISNTLVDERVITVY
jgi:hypothetical protein